MCARHRRSVAGRMKPRPDETLMCWRCVHNQSGGSDRVRPGRWQKSSSELGPQHSPSMKVHSCTLVIAKACDHTNI